MIVGVIDYGMGNLRSVQSALELFQVRVVVGDNIDAIAACDRLILPGVGSFYRAMENIRERGLDKAIKTLVADGKPLLGICLGMQLLAAHGTEDRQTEGLGLIDAVVEPFPVTDLPVPHMGFNEVRFTGSEGNLSEGLGDRSDFYFVHSYRMVCRSNEDVAGWCDYGAPFAALVRRGHVVGAQFHPEKSQSNGLKLMRQFLKN